MTSASGSALTARLAALTPRQRELLREKVARARWPRRLTPGQRRLWQTHQAVNGAPVDVVCQAVHLTGGRIDLAVLAELSTEFAGRHEALRTTFAEQDGEIVPVVHDALPPRVTLRGRTTAEQAHALARELAHEPFDLAHGPLLRVVLAEGAGEQDAWLLVVVHNLVFDAWSFELLLDALDRRPGQEMPAATPFSAFARARQSWVDSADGQAAATYWATEVRDAPPPLPTDRPRTAATRRGGARVEFTLSPAVAEGIATVARREAATAYAGWLAVAWQALERFGGSQDVLLGTFTAGRDLPGTDTTVGYLLNVAPTRLRDAGDGSFPARVRAASAVSRAGLRHIAYPGELIDAARFDAVFVFDSLGEAPRTIQGASVSTEDLDKGTARYDLTLAVYPRTDGVSGWLEYDTERYDEATARRLAELFTTVAEEASGQATA
ncbi:MAG TPA: condensation domain-containing protein [Pseudonocardiaceae bacterium]|jgi:hypothetical protein|nr:condensation domain-containing protein [Pseudonocardiaceae bacterium]